MLFTPFPSLVAQLLPMPLLFPPTPPTFKLFSVTQRSELDLLTGAWMRSYL